MSVAPADQGTFRRCIRLVIADRQPIVLQGLRAVFAAQRDFEVVASSSRGTSCVEAIRNLAPDVALLANTLPDLTGSEILTIARAENLPTRLVFFDSERDDDLAAAIAAGACSVISKYASPETLMRSLRRLMTERIGVSPGQSPDLPPNGKEVDGAKIEKMLAALTHREREIMRLVSEGLSNKEIGRQLNVSQGTVKVHLHNIFQKLEISNRTMLAAIALLQRPAGFGTLSLAALAFATMSEVKASDPNNAFLDDDSTAYKTLEHAVFELWTKHAIARHIMVVDPVLTQTSSSIGVSQVTNSAARMEELHTAQQAVLANFGRGYGPTGSSTPCLFISPLLQPINNNQTGRPTTWQQLAPLEFAPNPIIHPFIPPPLPSTPPPLNAATGPNAFMAVATATKSHGGDGTFTMTAAGVWVHILDNSNTAVQALEPGETLIDSFTVASMDGTAQGVTITIHGASDADLADFDNLALGPGVDNSHPPFVFEPPGHDSVAGEGNAAQIIYGGAGDDALNSTGVVDAIYGGSGNDTIKGNGGDDTISGVSGNDTINGNNGNDTTIGGYGDDRPTGSKDNDILVYLSAIDSNSTQFDTIIDFTSGENKINLAAFGALAFLHMTSASKSVPPHTLAWFYNPASNETIVYVNPTDRSLDIGDPALLEIHLQGVVSVAESDFVYEQEAAAVAAALEGIDPALLLATAGDGTVLTAGTALHTIETAASESALVSAGIWTMSADDGLRFHFGPDRVGSNVSSRVTNFGDDPTYATEESDDRAVTVPVDVSLIELAHSQSTVLTEENLIFKQEPVHANTGAMATGNGEAPATLGFEILELGMQSAAAVAVAEHVEPGVAPGNSGGHGNSSHPSHSAPAKKSAADELTEPGVASGNGVGHNHSHSSSASTMEAAEPVEPGVALGNGGGHGNSSHPSHSASAKKSAADELTEPGVTSGNGVGHNHSHSSHSASASTMEAAEPVEPGIAPGNGGGHGNSSHPSHSASAKKSAAIPQQAEPASGTGGAVHGQAFHFKNEVAPSTPTAAVEPEELQNSPVLLGAELAAILEVGPVAVEEHTAGHVNNGQHHAIGHLSHELLT
jgi:VCBS repeat-containing protein